MKHALFLIALACLALASAQAQTIVLKTDFQDTASKLVQQADGSFAGICIDLMDLVEQNSTYRFARPALSTPLKRIEDDLAGNRIDVYFALLRNASREKKRTFVEPLYTIKYILVSLAGNPASITSIDDFRKAAGTQAVLTVSGSTIMDYLGSLGLQGDDTAMSVAQNLEKLLGRRATYLVYHDIAILYELNQDKYRGRFKIFPLGLPHEEMWLVASKRLAPEICAGLKAVIKKLKKTGQWNSVVRAYVK